MPSATASRRPPSRQKYCVNCQQLPSCPTQQRARMERRLAEGGGPVARFLSRIVAAETAEDVHQEGRERRRAIVYAAKVRRLTKRVPPRTTPQTRRGRRAQEMTASVSAADAVRRQGVRQQAVGRSELRKYI